MSVAINCPASRISVDQIADPANTPVTIKVFPNPINGDEIMLEMSGLGDKTFANITDLSGKQMVDPMKLQMGQTLLITSTLASGVYLVHIWNDDVSKTEKLVIERQLRNLQFKYWEESFYAVLPFFLSGMSIC